MDYPRQQLILKKGARPPSNGKDIFAYGLDNRSPTVEITIGAEKLNILVDTGAAQSIVVPASMAAKFKFVGELNAGPTLSTFQTAPNASRVSRLGDPVKIGIHEVAGTKVHVWEDVPVLGSDLFKDFILTFDQKNRRLRISVCFNENVDLKLAR